MPTQYTPNPANHPTQIPRVSDGDPPTASSVNPSFEALADYAASQGAIGSGTLTEMAAVTGAISPTPGYGGTKFFCFGLGWYWFNSGGLPASDGLWIVDGVGGKWVHEHWLLMASSSKGFASIGVVPGYANTVANRIALPTQSIQRVNHIPIGFDAARWQIDSLGRPAQFNVAAAGAVVFVLSLPDNSILTSVGVALKGFPGHGALPTTMPTVTLSKNHTLTDVGTTLGGPTTDASASVPTYEAPHTVFALTSGSETIDNSVYKYSVFITGEANPNAVTGLQILGIITAATVTNQDPG